MSEFIQTKNALLRYFTDQQISQAARLICFFVALFALLQGVQKMSPEPLSKVFYSIAGAFTLNEVTLILAEALKFLILFASTAILMIFIIRAIFRFAVFSGLAQALMGIKADDLTPESQHSLHIHLHTEATKRLRKSNNAIFVLFPLNLWVGSGEQEGDRRKGWLVCIFLAALFTSLLMLLLW